MPITIGTLCTGIGLIDLGLERAGLGPVLWQVEVLPERRAVLAKWWPDVARYEDVRTVTGLPYVDCIAFGSPCKNLSSAGDRSGLDGTASRIFYDCLRVVREVRPRWVVFENVASGAKLWVDRVMGELGKLGYASLPVPISASDCGAPHRRSRIFVVAYLDRDVVRVERGGGVGSNGSRAAIPATDGHADGHRKPVVAEHAEVGGAQGPSDIASGRRDTRREHPARDGWPVPSEPGWGEPVPDMVRVVHGRADRLDGSNKRVAALGDSCTPQQAEVIGHIVRILDAELARVGGI